MRVLTARYKELTRVAYSWDGGALYALSQGRFSDRPFSGVVQRWEGSEGVATDVDCGPIAVERMTVLPGDELLVSGATRDGGIAGSRWVGPLMAPYIPGAERGLPGVNWHAQIAVSPTGDRLVAERLSFISRSGSMCGFQLPLDWPVQQDWEELTGPAVGLAFDPSGKRIGLLKRSILIVRRREKSSYSFRWHDAATGKPVGEPIPVPPIGETNFVTGGGTRLVTMRNVNLLAIDLTDPAAMPGKVKNPGGKHFTGLAVHPDARRVLATGNDHTVREYDAVTLQELRAFAWKVGRLRCVAIAPDGLTAAAGSDKGKVVVWDLE